LLSFSDKRQSRDLLRDYLIRTIIDFTHHSFHHRDYCITSDRIMIKMACPFPG